MKLVLFTGDLPTMPLDWAIVEHGHVADIGQSASLSAFAAQYFDAATLPLTVVLPGERIASRKLNIPARTETQLRQAASVALEDELAEPLDKIHVAVTNTPDSADKEIIAVPEAWLELWIEALQASDLTASIVTTDFLLLHGGEEEGCILLDEGRVVGNLDGVGFAAEQNFAGELLPDILKQSGCKTVKIYNHGPALNFGKREVVNLADRMAVLSTYIEGLESSQVMSFLQGKFKLRTDWFSYLTPWKHVAVMMVVCGIAWTLLMGGEGFKYKNASTALNTEATATFKSAFPNERIRNLQAQARSKLSTDGGASDTFLKLTSMLSLAANNHEGVEVYGLSYTPSGDLIADIRFDFASLEQLKSELDGKGITTREGRSPRLLEGNVYIGKLTLRIV